MQGITVQLTRTSPSTLYSLQGINIKGKLLEFSNWALFLDIFGSKPLLRTINNQNWSSIDLKRSNRQPQNDYMKSYGVSICVTVNGYCSP